MKKEIKKFFLLLLCLSLINLCSCSNTLKGETANNSSQTGMTTQNQTENLQSENIKLKRENETLKSQNEGLRKKVEALEAEKATAKAETTVQKGDVTVKLTGKSVRTTEYSQRYVDFVFKVTNNTKKSIKGIQGTCKFKDIFGVEIISMNCDFVGNTIKPGATITVSNLSFDCNQFMDDHMKLYNTNYDDILLDYTVTSIVFTDGTTKK